VEEMVANIEKCVQKAEQESANISGISECEIGENFLATKNGFIGWENDADFSHSMTLKKENIETKVSKSVLDYNHFSIEQELEKLFSQFHSLKNPEYLKPGKYNVILRPPAFAEIMQYLFWTMNRRDADEGSTPFTGQIGKQFFGEKFSVLSTLKNPLLNSPRYVNGGLPAKEIEWIKNGTLNLLPCERSYAEKVGCETAYPYNFYIPGENRSEKEMMNMVKNGLIINRLWYIRPIDRKNGEWTGLTRDGVLYFEDGKVQKSVTNFRWNEIFYDITRRILAISKSESINSYMIAPTVLIKDYNFVDTTTF
jgi:predicted Zn-dependent protease